MLLYGVSAALFAEALARDLGPLLEPAASLALVCQGSPGKPLASAGGCTAIEVMGRADLLVAESQAEIQRAAAAATSAGLDPSIGDLERSVSAAADLLREGDSCLASEVLSSVALEIQGEAALLDRIRLGEPSEDAEEPPPSFWAWLGALSAGEAVARAEEISSEMCALQGRAELSRATLLDVHDASDRAHLSDGRVLLLPPDPARRADIVSGASDVSFLPYGDETGVLLDASVWIPIGRSLADCLDPKILPLNHPDLAQRPRLSLDGYRNSSNTHVLEAGMQVTIEERLCARPAGATTRWAARVILDDGEGMQQVLGSQLEAGDISLPIEEGSWTSMTVTTLKQVCTAPVPVCDEDSCTIPPHFPTCGSWEEVGSKSYPVAVSTRGFFCEASYSKTIFELEDSDRFSYQSATVDEISTPNIPGLANPQFSAYAYEAAAPQATSDGAVAALIAVGKGQPFGVYSWEPCVTNLNEGVSDCFFPSETLGIKYAGTSTPSALRWPQASGFNSITGEAYAFSCKVPAIVRDRIADCPLTDTYYRLPYPPSEQPIEVSQGNNGSTSHGCPGKGCYAYDLPKDEGHPIYAMRGGVVETLYMQETESCWDDCEARSINAGGNVLVIRHADGTAAVYAHLPLGGAVVTEGQRVFRGQHVAYVGLTGRTTGPHLHTLVRWSESSGEPNWRYSIPSSFELYFGDSDLVTCAPLLEGVEYYSSNEMPSWLP